MQNCDISFTDALQSAALNQGNPPNADFKFENDENSY